MKTFLKYLENNAFIKVAEDCILPAMDEDKKSMDCKI